MGMDGIAREEYSLIGIKLIADALANLRTSISTIRAIMRSRWAL